MEDRHRIDFMKDYYALALVVVLNLVLFALIYRKLIVTCSILKDISRDNIEQGIEYIGRISNLRNDLNERIDELKACTENVGKSTNNWENAKKAFRILPWGVKVQNE